jgi:hypothetical protein
MFTGLAGLVSAFGLVVVDTWEAAPLVLTAVASFLALVVALLVDGARVRFLRRAWRGEGGAFEVMPAEAFASDASLAPLVANAGTGNVLVRVERRPDYRGAAATPIAFVGATEDGAIRPLRRRRVAAAAMLFAMGALGALAAIAHAGAA